MTTEIATTEYHIIEDICNQSILIVDLLIPNILNKVHELHKTNNEYIELYHDLFWTCAVNELERLHVITLDNQTKLTNIKSRFESTFDHIEEIDDDMYNFELKIEETTAIINSLFTSLELEIATLERNKKGQSDEEF